MASLPRPTSRPSNPPTGPLPSIPLPKNRGGSTASQASLVAAGISSPSALPQPGASRTTSTSSIPTTSSIPSGPSRSGPGIPTPTSSTPNASALTPAKPLRKTGSHGSLPSPRPATPSAMPPQQQRPTSVRSISSSVTATNTPRSSLRNSTLGSGARGIPTLGSSRQSGASMLASPIEDSTVATSQAASPNIDSSIDDSFAETSTIGPASTIGDDVAEEAGRGRRRSKDPSQPKDKGNVLISVRVRPEAGGGGGNAEGGEWMVEAKQSMISYRGKEGGDFNYDNVFAAHDKNAKVYDSSAKRLVRRVMEGYHGTVFAYGMTGTGKTFSMQGTATSPGVIPLAITDIFSFIRETPHREFLLRVSYLEIYNEKIQDLLAISMNNGTGAQQTEEIKLREDSKRGVYATPLKEEIVQSPTQLLRVIARGDHARRTASTQFNARSSRSHAVVQIVVESRERNAGNSKDDAKPNRRGTIVPGGVRVSTLSLIDLAGSERAAEDKERRAEGAHINKSLLTLGTVISKLSGKRDKQGNPMDKEGKHLPYRDSKLTRLLQSALSGNSLISILCTIQIGSSGSSAAAGTHTMETLNTLKFAARARNNIISHAKKAEESHANIGDAGSRALLDRYRFEILELRKQLEDQKKNQDAKDKDKDKDTEKDLEKDLEKEEEDRKTQEVVHEARHEEQMLEMQLARTALKERIEHLNRLILSSKSIGVNASRNMSSFSLNQQRSSQFSTADSFVSGARSVRSSASTQTLDPSDLRSRVSQTSLNTLANRHTSVATTDMYNGFEDEDLDGEAGDGTASLEIQVKSLQADLGEKNRYISQLEKRLTQARRTSRSRLSSSLIRNSLPYGGDNADFEAVLAEKDQEIADLRARLDDKDRMLAALQTAARKRDTVGTDSSVDQSSNTSPSPSSVSQGSHMTTKHTSIESNAPNGINAIPQRRASLNIPRANSGPLSNGRPYNPSPTSPMGKLMQSSSPTSPTQDFKRPQGVDEMTRLLDEMIRQKVEANASAAMNGGGGEKRASRRQSLLDNSGPITTERSAGPPLSRSARSSSRYSTDPTKLSGWETDVARRRASMMAQNGPPSMPNGMTNGAPSSRDSRGSSASGASRPSSQTSSATAIPDLNRGSSSSVLESTTPVSSSSDTTDTTPRPGDVATFGSASNSSSRPDTAISGSDDSMRPKGLGLQLRV